MVFSFVQQPVHPAQPWDGSDVTSQEGKLAVVTGANSGIGFFTARRLAERGAHVILACRSEKRGRAAEEEITRYLALLETPNNGKVEFMQLDLATLAGVRAFVETFNAKGFQKLDLLVNNAGLACPAETPTPDGFETQFQVNHLSHFYLTALLFPLLKSSPEARIINVSSHAHRLAGSTMDFDSLAKGTDSSFTRYGRSKLANLLFTFELATRLDKAGVSNVKAVAVHPGLTYSDMGNKWTEGIFPEAFWRSMKWLLTVAPTQETKIGSLPSLYGATAKDVANGDYYGPADFFSCRGLPVREVPSAMSQSDEDRTKLWELSERLTGVSFTV